MNGVETPQGGLTEEEAALRLKRLGPNCLPPPTHRTPLAALRVVASQPMVLLLLACMALYAVLGSLGDALMLLASVLVVAAISVYQELRTQRVLEALYQLASPRSTVVRDGVFRRISSHDLVEGDRLQVQEGDRLACDARVLVSHGLRVDESMLTGESVPVDKLQPGEVLHAGTLTVQGDAEAVVTATGVRTALGQVGGSMASLADRRSRLHEQLDRLVRGVALFALVTCVVVATLFAWRESSWVSGLLVGLTLAMSIVPEEFAVVWAVLLAIGAWRLSRLHVLTRRPQAIEALGSASVLCVDKTGTLTENHMVVAGLHDASGTWSRLIGTSPGHFESLLQGAADASVREGIEPMDRAIFELQPGYAAKGTLLQREGVQVGRPFVRQAWHRDQVVVVAMKGATEAVLARCGGNAEELNALQAQADAWARGGLRVIAVAEASAVSGGDVPETGYRALGLVAFEDPLRKDVPPAIRACGEAGLRVVMITGDSPATAWAIAAQANIVDGAMDGRCMTGHALDAMNEAVFRQAVQRVRVFARVSSAQKLRIVQALQAHDEVVAMTGDGVNDGPALRAADIGVAMGQRGTDVAREAAALVLLDDRFGSLVDAVRGGRRIFSNLRKAMGYLFAVHVPIVGVSLLPVLGGPVLLWPVHVVLLELIIDPACSLVFEAEPVTADTMKQGPRPRDAALFGIEDVGRALAVGAAALGVTAAAQAVGFASGMDDGALRQMAFVTIVVGNIAMLRWFRGSPGTPMPPNRAYDALLLAVSALMVPLLAVGPLRSALGFPEDGGAGWAPGLAALLAVLSAWRFGRAWHGARSRPASADTTGLREP